MFLVLIRGKKDLGTPLGSLSLIVYHTNPMFCKMYCMVAGLYSYSPAQDCKIVFTHQQVPTCTCGYAMFKLHTV